MIEHKPLSKALAAQSWAQAGRSPARSLELFWDGPRVARFARLPGWRAPLWRLVGGALELLRPEGRWRAELPAGRSAFHLAQIGAKGWMSGRGIDVSPKAAAGVWFDQNGIAQRLDELDDAALPPAELADEAQSSGECARWELTGEGHALLWLDDSFESGPFSLRLRKPRVVVSDGSKQVAYWIGAGHWCWPMADRGLLWLGTGRGGGWEPERVHRPIVI